MSYSWMFFGKEKLCSTVKDLISDHQHLSKDVGTLFDLYGPLACIRFDIKMLKLKIK